MGSSKLTNRCWIPPPSLAGFRIKTRPLTLKSRFCCLDVELNENFTKKKELLDLLNLQNDILNCAWKILKEKGTLIYSTCSVFYSENESQIDKFLLEHENAKLVDQKHHFVKISKYTDAFYFAYITKT